VLFPEAFVGGYPWGLRFGTAIGGRTPAGKALFGRYWASAITLPGPESDAIGAAAREAGVHLAVGVIERLPGHASTLYCTLAYYGPDGALLGIHRKLKPTAAERLVWGEGDGSTLPVIETPFGRVGGLICWENYMPLARMALYGKGVEFYLAPTADARDRWQATLRHIAVEGRCFVLGCNQFVTRGDYPAALLDDPEVGAQLRRSSRSGPRRSARAGAWSWAPTARCWPVRSWGGRGCSWWTWIPGSGPGAARVRRGGPLRSPRCLPPPGGRDAAANNYKPLPVVLERVRASGFGTWRARGLGPRYLWTCSPPTRR
jgi:predicted amidohydrolase